MPDIYLHEHTIRADEIDAQGHAGNVRYLHWMIDAAVAHSTAQGWSHDDYVRLGAAWVVRSHQIKYLQSAYAAETIVVRTWVASMKRFSSVRKYRIVRRSDEALLASAETEWVLVNMQTRALAPIPPQLVESFTIVDS
jgi:acyl-CoA thioester hydrolase